MHRTAARQLLNRISDGNAALLARLGITPLHPRTGMAAVGVINGKPVWPVAGGSEPEPEKPAEEPKAETKPDPEPAQEPEEKTDWKAEARKWEQRSKENAAAKKRLDDLEAANATELEKAQKTAEANEARARTATERAVKAEVRALADGFEDRTDAVLRLGDLTRFVDDDGEIDLKAIDTELAKVLKDAPHLAKREAEPKKDPKPGQRPTETLRPGAVPAGEERAKSLTEAVQGYYAS